MMHPHGGRAGSQIETPGLHSNQNFYSQLVHCAPMTKFPTTVLGAALAGSGSEIELAALFEFQKHSVATI